VKVPLTKYGLPQVVVFPAVILAAMGIFLPAGFSLLPVWAAVAIELVLAVIFFWVLAFFRDPDRCSPSETNLLLAPADGKITDIEIVKEDNFIGSEAMRIGIFLSIFNTHINRSPCNAKVEKITYKQGLYKNAANPRSGQVNESNDLYLVRTESPEDKLVVRQISGAIARRIVCKTSEGKNLAGGEKFGMIKFGSRTELYVPISDNFKCLVKKGDKVKAGITPLAKYS